MASALARSSRMVRPSMALFNNASSLIRSNSSASARVVSSADLDHTFVPPSSLRMRRSSPSMGVRATIRRHQKQQPRPRLVIFDKDGTLICFHSLWVPWVRKFAEKVEEVARLDIAHKVFNVLGVCPVLMKVKRGLLAEGTMRQIRDRIVQLLVQHGVETERATDAVEAAVHSTASIPYTERTVRQLHNLEAMFAELKGRGIKIAICTADSRAATLRVLRALRVEDLVDLVVCGDDKGSMPKPHPNNALFICRQLGIEPKDAMVIGDTPADLGMGRSAKLGTTVGVLSGVCDLTELAKEADHLVEDVGELIPLIG